MEIKLLSMRNANLKKILFPNQLEGKIFTTEKIELCKGGKFSTPREGSERTRARSMFRMRGEGKL